MNTYKTELQTFTKLVNVLGEIPAIGKKSAQKIAMSLCVDNKFLGLKLSHILEESIRQVSVCKNCFGISENEICSICGNEERLNGELCIVAHKKDIFTIEETGDFKGRYFVLDNLHEIQELDFTHIKTRIKHENTKEIIFALSPTLANDAVILFIEDHLSGCGVEFSKIAQGVPTGIGLDSIDSLSLSRALNSRTKI